MRVPTPTLEAVFQRDFARLVGALAVGFGEEASADAVQEAFIEAYLRWPKVSRYDDPAGWIRRVAVNRLINKARDSRRRARLNDGLPTTASTSRHHEEAVDLQAAVLALPRHERAAIVLYYVLGLGVPELAATLDSPEGTVKAQLHRARKRLRDRLGEDYRGCKTIS